MWDFKKCKILFDYTPATKVELPLKKGELICVFDEKTDNKIPMVLALKSNGQKGMVLKSSYKIIGDMNDSSEILNLSNVNNEELITESIEILKETKINDMKIDPFDNIFNNNEEQNDPFRTFIEPNCEFDKNLTERPKSINFESLIKTNQELKKEETSLDSQFSSLAYSNLILNLFIFRF